MRNRIYLLITLATMAILGSSCSKNDPQVPDPERVLLVYVGTDNNLGGYEQQKLEGLRNALNITPNDKVIAYIDSRGGEARLIEISNLTPTEQPRRIATYGPENSASAEVFARVVHDVRAMYPNAQSRGLLVFSHASGWLPEGAFLNPYRPSYIRSHLPSSARPLPQNGTHPATPGNILLTEKITPLGVTTRSLMPDGTRPLPQNGTHPATTGNILLTEKITPLGVTTRSLMPDGTRQLPQNGTKSLIQDGTRQLPQDGTKSLMQDGSNEMTLRDFAIAIPDGEFDYIAFEMCFMAGIEVAYELRNKADYILASSAEIVHPGFAPIYATATAQLLATNVQGFGQSAFAQVQTYAPQSVEHSATFSVIRTSELEPLAAFVRDNCDFSQAVDPADVQHFDRNAYHLFFDFEDYHARLLNASKQADLHRLIDRAVVWRAATPEFMTQQSTYNGFAIRHHSGLTAYLRQPQFAALNAEYAKLEWARATEQQMY